MRTRMVGGATLQWGDSPSKLESGAQKLFSYLLSNKRILTGHVRDDTTMLPDAWVTPLVPPRNGSGTAFDAALRRQYEVFFTSDDEAAALRRGCLPGDAVDYIQQAHELSSVVPAASFPPTDPVFPSRSLHRVINYERKIVEAGTVCELVRRLRLQHGATDVVDVGGGKGHLAQVLGEGYCMPCVSVDANAAWQHRGDVLYDAARRRAVRHSGEGAASHRSAIKPDYVRFKLGGNRGRLGGARLSSASSLWVGLHTCGPLADAMMNHCIGSSVKCVVNFGCCYQLLARGSAFKPVSALVTRLLANSGSQTAEGGRDDGAADTARRTSIIGPTALHIANSCSTTQSMEEFVQWFKFRQREYATKALIRRVWTDMNPGADEGKHKRRHPDIVQFAFRDTQLTHADNAGSRGSLERTSPFPHYESDLKSFIQALPMATESGDREREVLSRVIELAGPTSGGSVMERAAADVTHRVYQTLLARPVEHIVLYDRALRMCEAGYDVSLRTYFPRTVSTRNIGLVAVRDTAPKLLAP